MIYQSLAKYYDMLVKDEEATLKWVDFTRQYVKEGSLLELACGSAEITLELAKYDYTLSASDLSNSMLEEARKKDIENKVHFFQADMTDFHLNQVFDGILCYCDSVNYLQDENQFLAMLKCVSEHLKPGGWFLFDAHTLDRLDEFKEEYIEEGILDGVPYQWTIQSDEDEIHHHFSFWLQDKVETEMHVQHVYDPFWIVKKLNEFNYEVECRTDFDQQGIQFGEKVFFAAKKVG